MFSTEPAHLINLNESVVLKPSNRFGLDLKSSQFDVAGMPPGENHLQGHVPLEAKIFRLVDDSHSAAANLPQNFIGCNSLGNSGFLIGSIPNLGTIILIAGTCF
jgi:hypothetical protein